MSDKLCSGNRGRGGFTIPEVVVAAIILLLLAESVFICFSVANRRASATRVDILAAAIVRERIDRALTEPWTVATSPPAILATNAPGTDLNGDGAGDGSLYESNLPILIARDSKTGNTNKAIISGNLYRQASMVDTNISMIRVSFLLEYEHAGRTKYQGAATLRVRD
jgi:type II secretory pathway pseudopilin PulG